MTLAVALALAAVGVYASAVTGYGQGLGMIGFLVSVPWMLATPANPANLRKRRALFGGAAVSQGLLLAPLVRATLALHPGVLFTAFGGTAGELPCRVERSWLNGSEDCLLLLCLSDSACPPGKRMPCCQHLGIPPTHLVMPPACPALPARVPAGVFACFSAAALLSPRRQYLYLGGLLSSVLTSFMWMRLGTWVLGGGAALFQAELYVGLAVFSGYVVSRGLGWAGGRVRGWGGVDGREGGRAGGGVHCGSMAAVSSGSSARGAGALRWHAGASLCATAAQQMSTFPPASHLLPSQQPALPAPQVYDTQMVVERFEAGEHDTLRHALDLFIDFAAIFVRLLVILLRNAEAKAQREREREARAGGRQRGGRTTRL